VSADESNLAAHIRPAWSPDGNWIVFERQPGSQASAGALIVVSADGQTSFELTDGSHRDMSATWAGEHSIVFASDRGGAMNLWQVDVDFGKQRARGEPVQITLGAGEDFAPAIAPDGTLAYSISRRLENLWQISLNPELAATVGTAEQIMAASWNDFAPALTPDNSVLAFSSDRDGKADIWFLDEGANNPRQITDREGQDLQPVFSPDGSMLAFFSDERGSNDIWIMPMPGGVPVVTTPSESNDVNPYWSSDGSHIGFTSDRSGQSEVWKMDVDGGNAMRLTDISTIGHTARWSPDDQWLLFTSLSAGNRDVWAVSSDGERLRQITTADSQDAHGLWLPDSKTILYLADHRQVFATDLDGSEHRLVLDLQERIDYMHVSPDGETLVFTRRKVESDIWMIE
jgi:Tol biopolymer transport system component